MTFEAKWNKVFFILFLLVSAGLPFDSKADWFKTQQDIMGTNIVVDIWHADAAIAETCSTKVFVEMRRIDELMSPYKENSELAKVNQHASNQSVIISDELFELIELSLEFSEKSAGAFDITFASVGSLYNYRQKQKPSDKMISDKLMLINYRHIKLGDRQGRPWVMGVRHPRNKNDVVVKLPLSDTAISTSGDYERFFIEDGKRYHHIIKPGTGKSVETTWSATVMGDKAVLTDALSTTLFVLGAKEGLKLIDEYKNVDAIIIDSKGKMFYSSGLEAPN